MRRPLRLTLAPCVLVATGWITGCCQASAGEIDPPFAAPRELTQQQVSAALPLRFDRYPLGAQLRPFQVVPVGVGFAPPPLPSVSPSPAPHLPAYPLPVPPSCQDASTSYGPANRHAAPSHSESLVRVPCASRPPLYRLPAVVEVAQELSLDGPGNPPRPAPPTSAPPNAAPHDAAPQPWLFPQATTDASDNRLLPIRVPTTGNRQAVNERALELTRRGVEAAHRGAVFSAQADFLQALRMIADILDGEMGDNAHSQALRQAVVALQEADDFATSGSAWDTPLQLGHRVASHRTPVLKGAELEHLAPLAAIEQYYQYAQHQLAVAGGDEPAASVTLYAMGRLQEALTEPTSPRRLLAAPRAMACYQAALLVDRRNHLAANELGVLLAQHGRLQDARRVLLHGVSQHSDPAAWHNLATVHERLGESDLAQLARHEHEFASRQAAAVPEDRRVQWLSPESFVDRTGPGAPDPAIAAGSGDPRRTVAGDPRRTVAGDPRRTAPAVEGDRRGNGDAETTGRTNFWNGPRR
jgi:tetratricopeptide (TPR) repeat protein